MAQILYLHGAGATPLSFRWIAEHLPEHAAISVDMSAEYPIESAIEAATSLLETLDAQDVTIVGHSFGGVVGVNLLGLSRIKNMVTISAPFGGHTAAILFSMCYHTPFLRDLSPFGNNIRQLQNKWNAAGKPHTAIVTSGGLPIVGFGGFSDGDGVVTISSQMALKGPTYVKCDYLNHFEVLMSDKVVEIIKEVAFQ